MTIKIAISLLLGIFTAVVAVPAAAQIPCTASQGAAYCRAQWEATYPNSAGADGCWGNTDCNNGFCNYFTMNRCGTSNNTPNAQCCIPDANTTCQNGNAVSCNDYCAPGYATCRGTDFSFSCKYNLNTDINNCGACGNVCPSVNGTAQCIAGKCSTICNSGYAQCSAANACSVHTAVDPSNCGACGNVCSLGSEVSTAACVSSTCRVGTCVAGYGDCDGLAGNGCETHVSGSDVNNCGACGNVCSGSLPPHTAHVCSGGACGSTCSPGYADCDGNPSNGCETLLAGNDVNNCGTCGHVCPAGGASTQAVCNSGVCGTSSCAAGTLTCGGATCATQINTDAANCGGCGMACSTSHVTPSCSGGLCNGACATGYADCNGDKLTDGCETQLANDVANCGGCGIACNVAHAAQICSGGVCSYTQCAVGYADCDGNTTNGCETVGDCTSATPDMAAPRDMAVASDLSAATGNPDMGGKTGTNTGGCAVSGRPAPAGLFVLLVAMLLAFVSRRLTAR